MRTQILTAGLLLVASAVPAEQRPLTIEEVLFRANEYVVKYQREFSRIAADERSRQEVTSSGRTRDTRELLSDVVLVHLPPESWVGYRDTYEVDGKALRDRQERLTTLYLESPATANKVTTESTRFDVGALKRNFVVPMLPLLFLDPVNQFRFQFQKAREEMVEGTNAWVVEFTEYERPTFIRRGGEDAFARGWLWIDPTQGRIVKTHVMIGDSSSQFRVDVAVIYRPDEALGVWVPVEMVEQYDNPRDPRNEVVTCRVVYSRFRRFDPKPTEKAK